LSNQLGETSTTDQWMNWTADAFAADQYSEATCTVLGTTDNHALCVRMAGGATRTYYYCDFGATKVIAKFVAATQTQLKAVTATVNVGDVCRCEVVGNTIYYKINGVTIDSTTDPGTSIASGSPGIFVSTNEGRWDDWTGSDDLAAPGVALSATLQEATLPPSYF
jgi:hypothetical protein